MEKIKFATRRLTIISADVILNTTDYNNSFYELCLCFDNPEYNWNFTLETTDNVISELAIVKNLHVLLKCNNVSKMNGRKIRILLYKTKNVFGKWIKGWEFAGYGAYNSDRFIDGIFDGPIRTRAELEKDVAERECVSEILGR